MGSFVLRLIETQDFLICWTVAKLIIYLDVNWYDILAAHRKCEENFCDTNEAKGSTLWQTKQQKSSFS